MYNNNSLVVHFTDYLQLITVQLIPKPYTHRRWSLLFHASPSVVKKVDRYIINSLLYIIQTHFYSIMIILRVHTQLVYHYDNTKCIPS